MEETTTTTIKGGEIRVEARFKRSQKGILFKVKVHPEIEDLMRTFNIGHGNPQEARLLGRYWESVDGDPLMAYSLPEELAVGSHQINDRLAYELSGVGQKLFNGSPDRDQKVINLSFLRLVGASEGQGKSFHVIGVWERSALEVDLKRALEAGVRQFYMDFVKPIDVSIIVSTQAT